MSLLRRLFGARWIVLRLVIALFLCWALAVDTPQRLARLALSKLPDFDYAAEVEHLRAGGRYGEALMIADEGLASLDGPAQERLRTLRDEVAREQGSLLRRLTDAGRGAITGRGDSLESLVGAVTADFFVVGDVRDLVIQGSRWVVDGETDEVILALSGVGLATTIAPEVDWVPSVLKVARKAGSLTRGMSDAIVSGLKRGGKAGAEGLTALMRDVATLSRRASPGGAARLLRHADTPEDLATLARFVDRQPSGAFALHVLGDEGAAMVKGAARTERAADVGAGLVKAARKGPAGAAVLRTSGRVLTRPHPILGVVKAVYKGNAEQLVARASAAIDPRAWWMLPLAGAWVFLELGLLSRRLLTR